MPQVAPKVVSVHIDRRDTRTGNKSVFDTPPKKVQYYLLGSTPIWHSPLQILQPS